MPLITTEEAAALMLVAGDAIYRYRHYGHTTNLRMSQRLYALDPDLAYGYNTVEVQPDPPSSHAIDIMDAVMRWSSLIPDPQVRIRRVVALRLPYVDAKGRHILSWRRIANVMRCSHTHTKDMHATGVEIIVQRLSAALIPRHWT